MNLLNKCLEDTYIRSIEENYSELNSLHINIKEWITMSFELDFNYKNNEKLKQITKDLFDQIIYLRLTGKYRYFIIGGIW